MEESERIDTEKRDDISLVQISTDDTPSKKIEVPEGGRQGWMTVAAVFFFNCATWASNSAYAIYLAHYLKYNTFEGGTKLDYAAVGGIAFSAGLLFGPLIKLLMKMTSVRMSIIIGAVFQFVGLMLCAFSTKLWEIYCTQGLLIGFGLAFISMPAMTIIPQWFRKKRSLASSIGSMGSGIGGIVFNLALQAIIRTISLRWALIIQALMCLSCTTTGLILVRTRSEEIKTSMVIWDSSMLREKAVWLFIGYVMFTILGYVVMLYNLADFTISLGYSSHDGSVVACMVSVGVVFGRPSIGRLSDIFGPVTTSIFGHLVVGILCLAMWIPARNLATAIAFAIIQGGLMGSIWVVIAPISARLVGLRKLEVAMCMIWVVIGVFGMVSPVIGIKLRGSAPEGSQYDVSQYKYPAVWCGVVYLVSSICLWFMRAYLIVRDQEAERSSSHEDNDELKIHVTWTQIMRNLFSKSATRTV
uniref:MFS transporter n=1 Tax=Cyberlindnera americana TaxID=36016 RepID=A0A5P8N8M0_9ASCO|nr:MFS transporter [Cyberlindnera americana]